METYQRISAPISVQIEITQACNNRCLHCYNHFRESGSKAPVHVIDASKMQRIVQEIVDAQVFSATITGGEPLLNFAATLETIARLCKTGVDVSLNSNLTLLNADMAKALKEAGMQSILTSLHSDIPAMHDKISCRKGAFQETVRGIKTAMKAGIAIASNMVLLRENYDRIEQTAQFLASVGVESFAATKASPSLNSRNFEEHLITREQARESLYALERVAKETGMSVDILECYPLCLIQDTERFERFAQRSCTAGTISCSIGADGGVRPCSHYDHSYGNIFDDHLCTIWEQMSDWTERRYLPQACQSCQHSDRCNGGCRAEAKYYGAIDGQDPYMTCPEEVSPPVVHEYEPISLSDVEFEILPETKIREESFGGILYRNSRVVRLDREAFFMLSSLFRREDCDNPILVDPDGLIKTLALLMNKGIIKSK